MIDVEHYRALFPITRQYTFLDHAGVAPVGRHVTQAINAHLVSLQSGGIRFSPHFYNTETEIRRVSDVFERLR